jgi:signal transduction histidine kinase
MQRQLSQLLKQKTRLAQLGLAVSKINHDLRNMLANAQLISDRLTDSADPTVQRVAPKLIASLDRAINFCNETLRFGRTEESLQRREVFRVRPLIEEATESLELGDEGGIALALNVDPALEIDADREHLFRIFSNLCRNARQAIEGRDEGSADGRIEIRGWRERDTVIVVVKDNGPGVPPRAREKLFQPFQGSTRRGGTGLGLPISAELAQAHGGSIRLLETTEGAAFELRIPDRQTV